MKRFRVGHFIKTSLWFVPLLFVIGGVALSLAVTSISGELRVPQSVTGDATAALQILYLIAFSMLTLTGLILSLVVVVVQLAMGNFSPRIVRQILQDRPSQSAIGLFAGTFAYTVLAMRHVRSADGGSVPGLAVVGAIGLVLLCIVVLIWYVNHIGQSLRVAALVGSVATDTMRTIDHLFPDHGQAAIADPHVIDARASGVIFKVDHDRLVDLATRAGCRLELLWSVGTFVPVGAPLMRIVGDPDRLPVQRTVACVAQGPERTLNQDVAYGLRMLVDIAERSVASSSFEDPTTALQAIDRLHDLLRQLVGRPLHSGQFVDGNDQLRLTAPTLTWDGYVHLAFDEIRQAGAASPQVSRRLEAALEDLLAVAPPDRRGPLEHQLALLGTSAPDVPATDADRRAATVPDPTGIGSAQHLTAP